MAQKLRVAKEIPTDEFDSLLETILREDRKLLEMLAKV